MCGGGGGEDNGKREEEGGGIQMGGQGDMRCKKLWQRAYLVSEKKNRSGMSLSNVLCCGSCALRRNLHNVMKRKTV